ncbi:MAG: VWA domain-containing protein [Candidatus Atribacteria bacterium]|nr:MAG: VWA domain-containing protein [Candidatus Atribacteria bacterium]
MEIYTTALGALILELCCGHLPVYMHEKVRIPMIPGLVKVNFMEGLAQETTKNVELILDASNSMWGQIKGESKISIAKEVLIQIIDGLPEEMNVGLRVYGHRYKVKDERACQDTELVVPIGPLQKDQLIQTIEKITPKGKTPLVYSILQSPQDFINLKGGTVVLISDGIESCEGDIKSIAPKLKESGIELTVNIIGFGIKEEEARKQLETIAKSTGGIYLDAKDSQELLSSLQQALKIEYVLIDEKGKVKASGYVGGEAVSILEGEYILQLKLEPTFLETKVVVNPAKTSVFLLKKEEGKWTIKPAD